MKYGITDVVVEKTGEKQRMSVSTEWLAPPFSSTSFFLRACAQVNRLQHYLFQDPSDTFRTFGTISGTQYKDF